MGKEAGKMNTLQKKAIQLQGQLNAMQKTLHEISLEIIKLDGKKK